METSGTVTLTITGQSNASAGVYAITVLANSGDITHSVTLGLSVPGTAVLPPTNLSATLQ